MKKKIFIIITTLLIFMPQVKAECDNDRLNEIKNLAKNIEITYELDTELDKEKNYSENDYGDEVQEGNMKVIITGLSYGLQLKDETTHRTFYYFQAEDGTIILNKEINGSRTFKVYSNECEKNVRTISVKIPRYNEYSTDPLCEGIDASELKICGTWYEKEVDYDTFKKDVESYKQRLAEEQRLKELEDKNILKKVVTFFEKYYLYFIIGAVVLIAVTIIIIIRRKRSVLE